MVLNNNVRPNVIPQITNELDKSELNFKVSNAGMIPNIQQRRLFNTYLIT